VFAVFTQVNMQPTKICGHGCKASSQTKQRSSVQRWSLEAQEATDQGILADMRRKLDAKIAECAKMKREMHSQGDEQVSSPEPEH
jgi:hypothetical protein